MRLASPMPADARIAVVDAQGDEIMKTTAFRMPPSLPAEMDEVAGNDREGDPASCAGRSANTSTGTGRAGPPRPDRPRRGAICSRA
jgi:hypothetical protein